VLLRREGASTSQRGREQIYGTISLKLISLPKNYRFIDLFKSYIDPGAISCGLGISELKRRPVNSGLPRF